MAVVKLELKSTVGSINLAKYLNVQAGQGMDPADPQFSEHVFAHSLLKQGGTLALENLKLRELIYPLTLSANSKTLLTALVREINTIVHAPEAEVEWEDESASAPTFFDLAGGQFDVEYDFRQGQQSHPMVKGKLRLFVQPLATAATAPTALGLGAGATSESAIAPVAVFKASGLMGGDAPAQLEVNAAVLNANFHASVNAPVTALSVLPGPEYQPWMSGASSSSVRGASGGFNYGISRASAWVFPRFSFSYAGAQRVFALARRLNNASPANIQAALFGGVGPGLLVPVPGSSAGQPWNLLDLGTITFSSASPIGANTELSIYPLVNDPANSASIQLYGVVMLPENSTCFLKYSAENLIFDGTIERIYTQGGRDVTNLARGQVPQLAAAATPVVAFFGWSPQLEAPTSVKLEPSALPRTRYVF
jgi:hypothetical protein